ncbi:MAG TPA: sigma-70 family RNA polymerase sigma factor [Candidatus Limnocylindria bacterium]|nr:sigma-70 family RNA polymerase sigma factor [Candidatus Limnocylindria bacterium]
MRPRSMDLLAPPAADPALLQPPDLPALATAPLARDASIDELALAARDGDVAALGRLYDELVTPIYRYVALRVRRREDAEDLTQLVFERIVGALPRYRPNGSPFQAWAYRIARNAVIDHARRERNHEPLDPLHERPGDSGPEEMSMLGEEIRELRRAIRGLTPDQQEALTLRFAAGLSAEEAALVMGRRAGTVRGLTFRAITALRRRLGEEP